MANYSRWEDIKKQRKQPSASKRAAVEQDLALGHLHAWIQGWHAYDPA